MIPEPLKNDQLESDPEPPPPSSSQITFPLESVVRVPPFVKVEQFKVEMVRPPVAISRPAKVEVAEVFSRRESTPPENVEVEVFETVRLLRVVVPPADIVPEKVPDKVPETVASLQEPPEIVGVTIIVFVSLSIRLA